LTWIGRVSALDCNANSSTLSSTSPVGSLAFVVSGVRATTVPVIVTTLSTRTPSSVLNSALDMSITHCVMP
jgi:hypothetical protein